MLVAENHRIRAGRCRAIIMTGLEVGQSDAVVEVLARSSEVLTQIDVVNGLDVCIKAAVDAVVVPGGTLELVTGVTAMGYYAIGWFPKITQNIFASWSQLSPPSAAIGFNLQDNRAYREGRLGTNLVYEPMKDFTITLEAMAMRADLSGIVNGIATQIGNPTTAYQFSLQVSKVF